MTTDLPPFIKGMELSALFFSEAVKPLLDVHFPGLAYAAARLDFGSDVLGYDTPISRDHHWGPRLALYLEAHDLDRLGVRILRLLSERLPKEIRGYPTHFADLHTDGGVMQSKPTGPITPYISLITPQQFFLGYVGLDINQPLQPADWLAIPWQRLRTIASGRIFHDSPGLMTTWQQRLRWYPPDLWLYILAAQWRRIDQDEPFVGRTGDVGDDLGSRDIASRQVHRLVELCFLMEQRYPPYAKWFGTAFQELTCARDLLPVLTRVHFAPDWKQRERHLSDAYLLVGGLHNRLELTAAIPPEIGNFHHRPYRVPHSDRYVQALRAAIAAQDVRALPTGLGSIDQFVGSTDVLESIELCQRLKAVYQAPFNDRFPNPSPVPDGPLGEGEH